MSAIAIFSFENSQVRTTGTAENPLFVAVDIATVLGYSNARKAIYAHVDEEDRLKATVETEGGKQEVVCVNESGLYALIFGSKLESAKRFKRWVTSEVLPAIRKQGRYECPAQAQLPPPSLSEQQAYAVMSEVAKRAKNCGAHYQTIYRALKARYQVTKYTHIPAASFADAIAFIRSVELHVPEVPQQEPRKGLWLSDHQAKRLSIFLYELYDLFAPSFQAHYDLLVKVKSPDAPRFYESFHSFSAILLAKYLADNGYGNEATA